MRRFVLHQFPIRLQTYLAILLASLLTIIVITFFIEISEFAQQAYKSTIKENPLLSLVITPFAYVSVIYVAKFYSHRVQSSGIPQVLAALDSRNKQIRKQLLAFRIALAKIGFIFVGMLGGAPIGIEGPCIHISSSIFYSFNRFLNLKRKIMIHSMIVIGGCAGLLVAFNSPIAAILFAFEELGRNIRKQAMILITLCCIGVYLAAIAYRGNNPYLSDLSSLSFDYTLIWQLVPLAIVAGLLGGLFAKIMVVLVRKFIVHTKVKVLMVALILGSIVALFNYFTGGLIAGSGKEEVLLMLESEKLGIDFLLMKYFATLTSLTSTIPGGLFMPAISIGASIGSESSAILTEINPQVVIIMAIVAYLSGTIRTPLTAAFVVLEPQHCI
jgi:H+/Cl- antiporter ClcA